VPENVDLEWMDSVAMGSILPRPHLRRKCALRCHIYTGTGLTPAHICTRTGLTAATSAPGLGSPRPHLAGSRQRTASSDAALRMQQVSELVTYFAERTPGSFVEQVGFRLQAVAKL
jgi:trehalose-6-phosphatase